MMKYCGFFTLMIIFFSSIIYGQESSNQNNTKTFQIIKTGSKYSENQFLTTLKETDFCGLYLESISHDIEFDDGSIVRLLSKQEISNSNLSSECFVSNNYKFQKIIWSILPNGSLGKGYEVGPNKSYINN